MDGYARTLLKTLSWRMIATITTMVIVYLYTREMALSLGVGVFEVTSKLVLYYFHERLWQRVRWGKSAREGFRESDPSIAEEIESTPDLDTTHSRRLPVDVASD